jgi:hypothetical protein
VPFQLILQELEALIRSTDEFLDAFKGTKSDLFLMEDHYLTQLEPHEVEQRRLRFKIIAYREKLCKILDIDPHRPAPPSAGGTYHLLKDEQIELQQRLEHVLSPKGWRAWL